MKRFLIKSLLFALPIILCAVALEILLRNIPNEYSDKRECLERTAQNIETLALGSSHAFYGVNPEYLSMNAYNAAHVSQSLNYDYFILKKHINKLTALKTVVITVSYSSLYSNLDSGIEHWRAPYYYRYSGINETGKFIDKFEITEDAKFMDLLKKTANYYLRGKSKKTINSYGWGISYKSAHGQDLNETGPIAAKRHTKTTQNPDEIKDVFREMNGFLESIINECEAKDAEIFLFTPPAYKTYRENLNGKQLAATLDTMTQITNKFQNCRYVNFMEDERFTAEDFYDADHLNEIGAKKLTSLIDEFISKP